MLYVLHVTTEDMNVSGIEPTWEPGPRDTIRQFWGISCLEKWDIYPRHILSSVRQVKQISGTNKQAYMVDYWAKMNYPRVVFIFYNFWQVWGFMCYRYQQESQAPIGRGFNIKYPSTNSFIYSFIHSWYIHFTERLLCLKCLARL